MVRRKDSFWDYAEELENGRFVCKFCKQDFAGGISRLKSHLSGVRGRDIQICLQVPEAIQLEVLQAIDAPTKKAKSVAESVNVLESESISGSSSSHMPNLCTGHDKSQVDKQFAKLIISDRICYDAIQSPLFNDFVIGVAKHGSDYVLPSSLTLKSQLMPDIMKEVEEYVQNVIKYSVKTGCTLMYNIWPHKKRRLNRSIFTFVDIYAYTPIGVACMDPPDSMGRDIYCFELMMSSILDLIGPTNVVQFIINNDDDDGDGDEVSKIKDMLHIKYPWICQTPCATRGIELLLSKVYDVPFVYNTIKVAKWVVLYVYEHKVNVPLRRVHRKKDFKASDCFLLIPLLEVESELQALQVSIATLSSDWGKPLNDKQAAKLFEGANFIDYAIRCKEFWNRGKMLAQVMQSLFQAYCLVHCDGPTLGYLYEMMESVQDAVKLCCKSNNVLYDVVWKILNEVRSDIIHPIHAAAAFLNPTYMCSEKFKETVEMTNGVNYILERLVAVEEKEAFMNQVQLYRMKVSNLFTAQAMMMLKTFHPRIWWEFCGNHLPVLQKYAIRILSQPCSSSLCKRYQLRDSCLDDHAFMVNTMMMERYKSLETQMLEPIILDKLGEVFDDVNYQHLWDDGDFEYWFHDLIDCHANELIDDPTGSWLDRWPKNRIEPEQAVTGYMTKGNRQFLILTLLAFIQMKYQNSSRSPFDTHPTTMSAFIVTAYFYTGALVGISRVTQAIPNSNYLPMAMLFSDILGALACSLLIFILVPPFGVFLLFSCSLVLIRALHGSYQQIFELFQQIFNLTYQADPQASNGNSMEQEDNGGVPTAV
ncbi:uncharacterized protein LOC132172169 [Corylus avellana]|uniref:uncharacterized protein LOC132172169 n=1 Tax=Corylus avellana TaxID=13451 RepID=UPI00286BCB10|nr:uncharacterized protein LOC132172169 [Corylus avellana]